MAAEKGYQNVYRFTGGIPEWRSFNYPMTTNPKYRRIKVNRLAPAKVAALLDRPDILILDVRPQNYTRDRSFLAHSRHIPLLNFENMVSQLPQDRPILITDWAMKQSPIAAKFLTSQGYEVVGVLKGGIERWKHENRATIRKELPAAPATEGTPR